jgi:hypothetical protein
MSHSTLPGSSTPRWIAWWGLGLALISFGLGAWAYIHEGDEGFWDGVFKSLQMFHLHFHRLGEHAAAKGTAGFVSTPLEFARFGAAVVGLGLLPAVLVFALFRADISRWWVRRFWRRHVIVCGHCTRTLSLIKDLRRQKPARHVVFIGHCPAPLAELPAGVLYLEGEAQNGELLRQAAVHRADYLVALNEEDRANLEILIAAERQCECRTEKPLECYAHLQDTHLQGGLHKQLGDALSKSVHVRHHLFNYYELVARNLACQYPLPEALVEEGPLPERYVIVGFGSFGQNVALKLVKMGQQLVQRRVRGKDKWHVVKPRVTVIDPRGEIATVPFLRAHPAFTKHCTWAVHPWSCEAPEFLDLTFLDLAHASAKTSIIFCLENETISLRTALLLNDLCRSTLKRKGVDAIYLRIARPERLGGIVENLAAQEGKPRLVFFAPDSEIFSASAILRSGVDALARAVHEAYRTADEADARANNKPTAAGKTWEQLASDDRESSREAADHTWAKLRTLGYDIRPVPANETPAPASEALLREIESREDELARVEHYRWMTWRLLTGWTHGSPRDNAKKHHPDLTAYEKLRPSTQDKDKVIIRAIPVLLKKGRLQAVKR